MSDMVSKEHENKLLLHIRLAAGVAADDCLHAVNNPMVSFDGVPLGETRVRMQYGRQTNKALGKPASLKPKTVYGPVIGKFDGLDGEK